MVSGRSKLPWLSARLPHVIRRKNRIYAKYKKTERRKVTRSLRSERNELLNQVIGDIQTNPKPFWNYIRSQRKDSQVLPPLKTPAGTTVDSDYEKAEALNSQFQNNWSLEDVNSVPFLRKTTPGSGNIVLTTNSIIKLLNNLKQSKSEGPDEIYAHVFKEPRAQVKSLLS